MTATAHTHIVEGFGTTIQELQRWKHSIQFTLVDLHDDNEEGEDESVTQHRILELALIQNLRTKFDVTLPKNRERCHPDSVTVSYTHLTLPTKSID